MITFATIGSYSIVLNDPQSGDVQIGGYQKSAVASQYTGPFKITYWFKPPMENMACSVAGLQYSTTGGDGNVSSYVMLKYAVL